MAKKPAKKAAKPAKAAPKKAVKSAAKPVAKKAAPKKAAKTPVKKAVKPAPTKKVVAKKGHTKPVAKAKKPVKPVKAVKAAPAKATPKPVAKKAVVEVKKTAPVKAAPAKATPVKAAAPKERVVAKPNKPAPAPQKPVKKEAKEEKAVKETARSSKPLVTQVVAPNRPMAAPVVKKQVSTLESADKLRYSDEELNEFRDLINKKLEEARKDYDLLKQTLANTDNNGTDDTSPSFKMIEDGSETLSREETAQLASRQEKFIKHLEDALLRIRNKTYGICRVTGRLISKERLRLVPHATLSIEAKQQMGS
jgi:RNA polymerase-binding transcription factor DksA